MLAGLVTNFTKKFPSTNFWIGSIGGKFDEIRLLYIFPDMRKRIHLLKVPALRGFKWFTRVFLLFIRYIFIYPKCDLGVHIGGDGFSDSVLNSTLMSKLSVIGHSYQLLLGRLFRKPVVACSTTIGPFDGKFTRLLARFALNHINLIIARDATTKKYLEKIGIKTKIQFVADLAFLLEPASKEKTDFVLKENGISPDDHLAFIVPNRFTREIPLSQIKNASENSYFTTMVSLVDYLCDKGFKVILIAQTSGDKHEDIPLCQEIQQHSKAKPVIIDNLSYTPQEIKGIMGCCEFGISSKLHASVYAFSIGTPTITIASQEKIFSIIGDMCGMHKWIIDFKNTDPASLTQVAIEKIGHCLSENKKIRNYIQQKYPEIRKSALQNIELIAKTVKTRGLNNSQGKH